MFLSLLSSAFYTRNFCSEQHNRRTESALWIVIVLISKLKNTIPFLSVSGMSRIRFRDFDRVRDFEKIVWLKTESQKIRRH